MMGTVPRLLATLLLPLSSLAAEHNETVGFRITLMPPCQLEPKHRSATDFMGNSVALEIHASGSLTINGDSFRGRPWMAVLREVFSTRATKTLLIAPDQDVRMGQILTVLDQLNEHPFLNKTILLTPKQGQDIRNEFCIMNDPS